MEQLSGTVTRIITRKPDGYAVVALKAEGHLLPVTVVGKLVEVEEGLELRVEGRWTAHQRFGRQFRVTAYESRTPDSVEGMLRYLGSGAIEGVGPALATRLVEAFGPELFSVVERDPLLLMQVSGIGRKRAKSIARSLLAQRVVRDVMVFLQGLGIGPALAARIYRCLGDKTVPIVRDDPYALVQAVEGVGFATADNIARRQGVAADSPSRLSAGLLHVLAEALAGGDTVILRDRAVRNAQSFLEADIGPLEAALQRLIDDGAVRAMDTELGEAVVGLRAPVYAEREIADELRRLLTTPIRAVSSAELSKVSDFELTELQRAAVQRAAAGPLAIITGGPGTGKTTVLRTLVRLLEVMGERPHLCAPTGRAAKRLSEATETPAATVHRLLGFHGGGFEHDRENPLERTTVIVDETSMVDVWLMRALLRALPDGARLVLVGDSDQLPSVGPGNVLGDLIGGRERLGAAVTSAAAGGRDGPEARQLVIRLTTVFRQAETSRIVANAHRIREGQLPVASPTGARDDGVFHWIEVDDPRRAQQLLLEVCCERIPRAFGLDARRDVQVLSPMHRGELGTVMLNQALQQRLNARGVAIERRDQQLRVGDKVMQIRNDYERDVFNGDIGWITGVDPRQRQLTLDIGGGIVSYKDQQIDQLTLAYCVSIHKSQGSEYPAVVVPLSTQHYVLLQRNLLYTAVTRARGLVVLIGSREAVRLAVQRADRGRRKTVLPTELRRALEAG